MTEYDIRLCMEKGDCIHETKVRDKTTKYEPAEISGMLAGVVMGYLKGIPYPGPMKARVTACGHRTEFILLPKNDFLEVYYRAGKFTLREEEDLPKHLSRIVSQAAKEDAA